MESIRINRYAEILSEVYSVKIGTSSLLKYLREKGYLTQRNKPIQTFIEEGIFELKYQEVENGPTEPVLYITGLGQFKLQPEIVEVFDNG